MTRYDNILVLFLIFTLLQACAGSGVAPVAHRGEVKEPTPAATQREATTSTKPTKKNTKQKSGYHIVAKGDTMYSIAWRYNVDYKEIANWNNIAKPYTIYPGQFIRLKPVAKKKGTPLKTETVKKSTIAKKPLAKTPEKVVSQKPVQKKPSVTAKVVATRKPALPNGPIKWFWPVKGKLVKSNSPTSKKGIDIAGKNGQAIKAAAAGEVVYSGSGLLGFGKLIIIKHNETYLSAYAYNSKLLVKEGDRVKAGQDISRMGQDHSGRNILHFEIRKNGKPVEPTKHLPKLRA